MRAFRVEIYFEGDAGRGGKQQGEWGGLERRGILLGALDEVAHKTAE